MKILVTGATGFIGGNFLEALGRRGEGPIKTVYAVSRSIPDSDLPFVRWVKADLGAPGWVGNLPEENIDVVIHLAQSKRYREFPGQVADIFNVNTKSTVDLADWAIGHKVNRFLFASTGNVYGSSDCLRTESDACKPDSMYGASKLGAEILLRPFATFFDIAVLRFFGVYGPGQANMMIPDIIKRFINGDEITLAGNVGVRFNPIFIADAVNILAKLASEKLFTGYEVLNVGGSEVVDLKQLTSELVSISKDAAKLRVTEGRPTCLMGAVEKIRDLVGAEPYLSFREGLRMTYQSLLKTAERV